MADLRTDGSGLSIFDIIFALISGSVGINRAKALMAASRTDGLESLIPDIIYYFLNNFFFERVVSDRIRKIITDT